MTEPSEAGRSAIPQLDMQTVLKDTSDFAGVKTAVVEAITKLRGQGFARVGFVSGSLGETSGYVADEAGSAWQKSMDEMKRVEKEMIVEHQIPIFSSTDIFRVRWDQLVEGRQIQQEILVGKEKELVMDNLFGGILKEGGITDIFMMKGSSKARGSRYEHSIAIDLGIKIWQLDPSEQF